MYFIFLILQEMSLESDFNNNNNEIIQKNLNECSHNQLVIFLIIILNIISSVVRFLGSIFMLILAKLFYKLKISNKIIK